MRSTDDSGPAGAVSGVADGPADAEEILRAHGCRATKPRVAVLRALLRHGGPIDAATLTALAQREASGIHEATVYRTINALSSAGVVAHVHAGHGPSLINFGPDHPIVAVCRRCGSIVELPGDVVGDFGRAVAASTGFTVSLGHFALEGTCAECT